MLIMFYYIAFNFKINAYSYLGKHQNKKESVFPLDRSDKINAAKKKNKQGTSSKTTLLE